ncbi:MAG: dihydroneopterin aldolase [Bacteroidales bacterium]|nr:dihydroneopterin aldolase [Bacteroidales bacterium]
MDKYSTIKLEGMEFYGYVGDLPSEKTMKNLIVIDFAGLLDISRVAKSDNIADAVDYTKIYDLFKTEVDKGCNLLETLASNCCRRLKKAFPQFECGEIKVAKPTPLLAGGKIASASVIVTFGYDE